MLLTSVGARLSDLVQTCAKLYDIFKAGAKLSAALVQAGARPIDIVNADASLSYLFLVCASLGDIVQAGVWLRDKAGEGPSDLVQAGTRLFDLVLQCANVTDCCYKA